MKNKVNLKSGYSMEINFSMIKPINLHTEIFKTNYTTMIIIFHIDNV